MKAVICSLVAICALLMVLASSAIAGGVKPTTPRASEYIEVHCLVGGEDVLFNRPAAAAFSGQTQAQTNYDLHHEEQCSVVAP